ncbi:efflux RND transporter periplasmic adaptor subunit [Anatilimnocola sp. NA78]|uniref:efflux RND transporter periplasmic adaptor subunit n=1 Tax=Anatilimnocola sp. NA78 TaxID=3415683 RepID=UPI003CE47BCD
MTLSNQDKRDALSSLRIRREDRQATRSAGSGWLGRLVLGIVALLLLGIVGWFVRPMLGDLSNREWIPDAVRSRPEVRVTKVVVEVGRAADAVVVATGYIESYRQANIGARAAGRIEAVMVEEGSLVKKGEVIAVLDHKDVEAALAGAKAALKRAKAELGENEVAIARAKNDLERASKLQQSSALPQSDHDTAYYQHRAMVAKQETLEAAILSAEARVQETEQFKENMIVRAPFDGTVISKDAEIGESILPGGMGEASGRGSVVTVADLKRLEVECDVKEDYISRIRSGSPCEVAVEAVPDRRYAAKVRKVIPMGDRARATIKVKVEILDADERLFPDMSATVYFLPEATDKDAESGKKRIFCDSGAVVTGDGKSTSVWTLDDRSRARLVEITVGGDKDGRTEILSGLAGGERVIVRPPEGLQDGSVVKLRE